MLLSSSLRVEVNSSLCSTTLPSCKHEPASAGWWWWCVSITLQP